MHIWKKTDMFPAGFFSDFTLSHYCSWFSARWNITRLFFQPCALWFPAFPWRLHHSLKVYVLKLPDQMMSEFPSLNSSVIFHCSECCIFLVFHGTRSSPNINSQLETLSLQFIHLPSPKLFWPLTQQHRPASVKHILANIPSSLEWQCNLKVSLLPQNKSIFRQHHLEAKWGCSPKISWVLWAKFILFLTKKKHFWSLGLHSPAHRGTETNSF